MGLVYHILLFALLSVAALAAVVTPFSVDGTVAVAVADSAKTNSGGRISVNGWSVTVPQNLIVQFPNSYVPFQEFANGGNFVGDEVSINGNIVGGVPIAAQIFAARNLGNAGQGVIDTINYADGSMKIVGGPTIRLNDPNGVFSVGGNAANAAYAVDDESPSVTSASGFPMCIPRSSTDPLCPLSNRPANKGTFDAPDPMVMVPFQPGDFIEFSGVPVGNELVAYAVNCPSVMVTTTGTQPYIRVEDAVIGIFDGDTVNNEFGDTKFTGYATDQGVSIAVYAQDVDPCTGVVTDRAVGSATVKAGDARNKWEWRADTKTFSKYTREYKFKVNSGTKVNKNGIVAGIYIQPVTEWILPELLAPGQQPNAIPWDGFPQYTNGIYQDGFAFGQLMPWPGASAPPAPPTCTKAPPTTIPTAAPTSKPTLAPIPAISQCPGTLVTLVADLTNTDLTFNDVNVTWSQTSGSSIVLSDDNTPRASFVLPLNGATAQIQRNFKVAAVLHDSTLTGYSAVNVTSDKTIKDVVTIDSYTWTSTQGGTISVIAHSNVIIDGSSKLQLFLGTSTTAINMVDMGKGVFSYSARSVKKLASITVKSAYGGVTTVSATTA